MDNLDLERLTELVETLRDLGIEEFRQGDLHLRLAPAPRQVVVTPRDPAPLPFTEAAADARKRAAYASLFPNGVPPSFARPEKAA